MHEIAERTAAWRERRVLLRVSRPAWRLDQAERGRNGALASARAEGVPIRAPAAAARLSPSRVHQIVTATGLDELGAAGRWVRCGRRAGRPRKTPMAMTTSNWTAGTSSPAGSPVRWAGFRQCPGWLTRLHADDYPPAASLRPGGDHPEPGLVVTGLPRVAATLGRIAAGIGELARARRVQDLNTAAVLPDPRAERRRRLAEPDTARLHR